MICFNQNDYDNVAYNKPDGTKATLAIILYHTKE
jgi:hypothetical protein